MLTGLGARPSRPSRIPRTGTCRVPEKFFTVEKAGLVIGPELVRLLEAEIRARDLGLIVLDSYTKMRPARGSGIDIVKAESRNFGLLNELAKASGCVILIIHHRSKGSAGLDSSERTAGTYAISAATEGQIHITRFAGLPATADERLVQIRARRFQGVELVVRFRPPTLDYEFVLDGPAASHYPEIVQLKAAFGQRAFAPKDLTPELALPRRSAHRLIARLEAAGALNRCGYGQYVLRGRF